jgi:hypothetical protein
MANYALGRSPTKTRYGPATTRVNKRLAAPKRDIQLKGSGPTPFSRQGDGRAALGPVLPATQMGPLVSEEQFARVTGYIESGKKEGAKIKTGQLSNLSRAALTEPSWLRSWPFFLENSHHGFWKVWQPAGAWLGRGRGLVALRLREGLPRTLANRRLELPY